MKQTQPWHNPFDDPTIDEQQEKIANAFIAKFNEQKEAMNEAIIKSYDLVKLIEIKSGQKVKSFKIDYEGFEDDYIDENDEND